MTSKELQERIAKATAKIEKKQNTIVKYQKTITKKHAELEKITGNANFTKDDYWSLREQGNASEWVYEAYWVLSDIESAQEGIKNNTKQIEETRKTIAKYEAQLANEIKRESTWSREIPETMKEFRNNLVEEWTRYDIEKKNRLRKAYDELGYREFVKKYNHAGYVTINTANDDFRKENKRTADALIINLWNRVKEKTGTPETFDLYLNNGNSIEGIALNGWVHGTEGTAQIESILAGGYNIQRLHIRVLVK